MRRKKKVLVAMSGGIDSSLAAALLKRSGHETIGATMKLWPASECGRDGPLRACCSLNSIEDARQVAAKLDMPHYVFDFHREFKDRVIDYFCGEYARGFTPNPCILCNQKIKFDLFLKKARELGCGYIATGHYAGIGHRRLTGRYFIKEGADRKKDQSYFLFVISQESLSKTIFPLENMTKAGSRRLAEDLKLKVYNKKSSQEVCFIPGRYTEYIEKRSGNKFEEGDILNTKGERAGRHKGIHFYTIGQRKGIGVPYKKPLYVLNINREKNSITVGTKEEVMKRAVIVRDPSWGPVKDINKPRSVLAKIRYGHEKAKATVERIGDKRLKLTFCEPQEAPTPGQAAVFYKEGAVLGGGWIDSVLE